MIDERKKYRKEIESAAAPVRKPVFAALTVLFLLLVFAACLSPSLRESPQPIPIPDNKPERDERLQTQADGLLHLFDRMPPVPVYLNDEAILKSGSNTEKGIAYTHCSNRESPSIIIKKSFYQKANQKQLINALKHELTHAWLCRQGLMSIGHGAPFRRKFEQIGGFGN